MKTEIRGRHAWIFCVLVLLASLMPSAMADPNPSTEMPVVLPSDPFSFHPGPGSTIASSYCEVCHSAEYIYMQPPHSKKTWTKIVLKMKSAFGCSIPDDQIPLLVKYLVGQNDIQATSLIEEARTQPPLSPKSEGHAGKGKAVYEKNCVTCHGTEGKGDGPIGKVLVPPAGDLTTTGNKSDQDLLQTIQNGRPGTAMPSWKGGLSPQDMQDVLAYIRSLNR